MYSKIIKKGESIGGQQLVELAGTVERGLGALGRLVHLVDDEAGQDGVHGQTVHAHEEGPDGEGDDEDDLNKSIGTSSR